MTTLKRITTDYIDVEDRIRVAGEYSAGAPVVIWLTRRLLQRLLPALLLWLERQGADTPHATILLGFAQQAARAELAPAPAVQTSANSTAWLVLSVDVAQSVQAVGLTFKGTHEQRVTLTLAAKPLRQWLSILYDAYRKAEWPLDLWPQWLRESNQPAGQQGVVLH